MLLLGAAVAANVDAATTGQLAGRVVDDGGVPLPGVSVTAGSPTQIGGLQTTQTDAQGWFQYPRLNPGYFTVRLELDGFLTQELTEVQVRLDRMTQVQVTLPLATFADQVVVTETTPVVDPQQVSTGQTFTSDYLAEAAIGFDVRWAYSQVLLQAPGTTSTVPGGESGGRRYYWEISVFGSTGEENVFMVDGLDTSDAFWGGALTMIPLDSIQEVAFDSGGFEAEYGRATGGVINALTKSGSNTLVGTVDFRYQDNSLETSGDHYDPDEQESGGRILGATLGGRFVSDRAWFFGSFENLESESTPTGALATYEETINRGFVKVTGQATPSWLLLGKYQRSPTKIRNFWSDPFTVPEANRRVEYDDTILQAEASGVLSPSLLWEMQVGSQSNEEDWGPMSGDTSLIMHFNLYTGMFTGNALLLNSSTKDRDQLGTALTWFVDDALGSHEIKGGGEYHRTSLEQDMCWTGRAGGGFCRAGEQGYWFFDWVDEAGNSIPDSMDVQTAVGPFENQGSLPSLFVQDAWRVLPNMTLKLGLRWDRSVYDNQAGEEVADLEILQPRLGLTWDLTRNGRNLVRATWGRFMDSSALRLARLGNTIPEITETWLSCSEVGVLPQEWGGLGLTDPAECAAVASSWGLAYRTDPENWDPAGWFLVGTRDTSPHVITPDLEAAFADMLILGYERELFHRTSLGLSFVDKATRDIIEDTCIENYPTPTPDACSGAIIANIPQARTDYTAWILNFESRAVDRLHVLASYTNSESKGSTSGGTSITSEDFDLYPYHWDNRYGYLGNHRKHRVKVNGYVLLPLDFGLAINGIWGSPFRWTPVQPARVVNPSAFGNIFVEPRGSREGDEWAQLDLQLTKGFRLGRVRLQLIGTVLNLFDAEKVTDVCHRLTGCGDFELGEPTAWQLPRRYELGLRLEF
jgi:hypothetical protein